MSDRVMIVTVYSGGAPVAQTRVEMDGLPASWWRQSRDERDADVQDFFGEAAQVWAEGLFEEDERRRQKAAQPKLGL